MNRTQLLVTVLAAVAVSCATATHSGKAPKGDPTKMTCDEIPRAWRAVRPRAVRGNPLDG